MLFLLLPMVLLVLLRAPFVGSGSAGTVLFKEHNRYGARACWSQEQLAKLRARQLFEDIIPPPVTPDQIDRKYAKETLRYLRSAIKHATKNVDPSSRDILQEAIADTIGSHLRRDILPNVKFAYYAGYIPFTDVKKFDDLYEDMKTVLNTKGVGWTPPARIPRPTNLTVGKILIGMGKLRNPCSCLVVRNDDNDCIRLPIPRLDSGTNPSAIALPFRSGGLFSLSDPTSENILLNYYTTAARCILNSSPESCRHSDFVTFNSDLWHWMKRSVAPHIVDENLFPAFGGVLRVAAAVQNYGKGLSRRNLIDDFVEPPKYPWRTLTHDTVFITSDWTAHCYIGFVFAVAVIICCAQLFYDRFCSTLSSRCCCLGAKDGSCPPYTVTTSTGVPVMKGRQGSYTIQNYNTMLPTQMTRSVGAQSGKKHTSESTQCKSKVTPSSGTIKTQRVYDLNENTEKLMSVIMSDNEGSIMDSSSSSSGEDPLQDTVIDMRNTVRTSLRGSPPQIEATVAQLKLDKPTCMDRSRRSIYTTDTATATETTCQGRLTSDTVWSGSTTSSRSITSVSAKTPRRFHDLAWARRVASKASRRSLNQSTTQADSFVGSSSYVTTPTATFRR